MDRVFQPATRWRNHLPRHRQRRVLLPPQLLGLHSGFLLCFCFIWERQRGTADLTDWGWELGRWVRLSFSSDPPQAHIFLSLWPHLPRDRGKAPVIRACSRPRWPHGSLAGSLPSSLGSWVQRVLLCALGKRIKGRQSDRVWARWLLDETRDLHCHWLPHQVKKVLEEKPYPGTTWVAGHFLGETEMLSLSITCNNAVKWLPRGTCPSPPSFNINYHSKISFVFFNSPTL